MPFINEADDWSSEGPNIVSPENIELLRRGADDVAPVIVEHWHYYGSRAPDRFVFDSYEKLDEYIRSEASPGDLLYMWNFTDCCPHDNPMASGKIPDERGRVPKRGAY